MAMICHGAENIRRNRAVWSARKAHNLEVGGSNPPSATKLN